MCLISHLQKRESLCIQYLANKRLLIKVQIKQVVSMVTNKVILQNSKIATNYIYGLKFLFRVTGKPYLIIVIIICRVPVFSKKERHC